MGGESQLYLAEPDIAADITTAVGVRIVSTDDTGCEAGAPEGTRGAAAIGVFIPANAPETLALDQEAKERFIAAMKRKAVEAKRAAALVAAKAKAPPPYPEDRIICQSLAAKRPPTPVAGEAEYLDALRRSSKPERAGPKLAAAKPIWCAQCDQRKAPHQVAACTSQFCKAKQAA